MATQFLLRIAVASVVILQMVPPRSVGAADYPDRPVRLVVGFAPGGGTDVAARFLAQRLMEIFPNSNFVVENRAGASGTLGTGLVAKSPPDGYTLSVGTTTTHSVAPQMLPNVPYNPVRDFAPITELAYSPLFLVVHPSTPIKTVGDLIKLAKARPNDINYGSGGVGTTLHMAGELFKVMTGTRMTVVAYKGEGPAIIDLIGGQISLVFSNVPAVLQHVRNGGLRGVAVTSTERISTIPEFPTVAESGVPGFEAITWFGFYAPAGTPPDLVNRLNAAAREALQPAAVKEKLLALGMYAVGSSTDEFQKYMEAEYVKWGKVIKDTGLTAK